MLGLGSSLCSEPAANRTLCGRHSRLQHGRQCCYTTYISLTAKYIKQQTSVLQISTEHNKLMYKKSLSSTSLLRATCHQTCVFIVSPILFQDFQTSCTYRLFEGSHLGSPQALSAGHYSYLSWTRHLELIEFPPPNTPPSHFEVATGDHAHSRALARCLQNPAWRGG